MGSSDAHISTTPQKVSCVDRVCTARRMRDEGYSVEVIAQHLGVEHSYASRLSRMTVEDLDFLPADADSWEYKPLWVRKGSDGDFWRKVYVREDGKVWAPNLNRHFTEDVDVDGYSTVTINGRSYKVHRLVLFAFRGPPPSEEAAYARHLNGVASCNFYTNLEWGTLYDNAHDKIACGRQRICYGSNNPWYSHGGDSKLADANVTFITRRMSFDAGHRIPFHWSKCSSAHGHLYTIEVTFFGLVKNVQESTEDGMVLDFGEVKDIVQTEVVDRWDHGFLVWRGDKTMLSALSLLPENKTIILDLPPTAECLARIAFIQISQELIRRHGFSIAVGVQGVRLYETPNCFVDYESVALKPVSSDTNGH